MTVYLQFRNKSNDCHPEAKPKDLIFLKERFFALVVCLQQTGQVRIFRVACGLRNDFAENGSSNRPAFSGFAHHFRIAKAPRLRMTNSCFVANLMTNKTNFIATLMGGLRIG